MNIEESNKKIQLVESIRRQHGELLLKVVQENLKSECERTERLRKLKKKSYRDNLEKQFSAERQKERKKIERLKQDQNIVLRNAIEKLGLSDTEDNSTKRGSLSSTNKNVQSRMSITGKVFSGEDLSKKSNQEKNKSSTIKDNNNKLEMISQTSERKPNDRQIAIDVQSTKFYSKMYEKGDRVSLRKAKTSNHRGFLPPLTEKSLDLHSKRSERSLLKQKYQLLNKLHNVISQQEQIIRDDMSTVYSSVSSFHESQFSAPASEKTINYVPFKNTK